MALKFSKGDLVVRVINSGRKGGEVDGFVWQVNWYNEISNNIRLVTPVGVDDKRDAVVFWTGPSGTYFRLANPAELAQVASKMQTAGRVGYQPNQPLAFSDHPLETKPEGTMASFVGTPEGQAKIRKIVEYLNKENELEKKVGLAAVSASQEMVDGLLVSTDMTPFHLIPTVALRELGKRIMLGEKLKGKDAWNAMSDNQNVLSSRKALARRLGHLMTHASRLLEKIHSGSEWDDEDLGEAAAIMWGGMYAICSVNQQIIDVEGDPS